MAKSDVSDEFVTGWSEAETGGELRPNGTSTRESGGTCQRRHRDGILAGWVLASVSKAMCEVLAGFEDEALEFGNTAGVGCFLFERLEDGLHVLVKVGHEQRLQVSICGCSRCDDGIHGLASSVRPEPPIHKTCSLSFQASAKGRQTSLRL